MLTFFRSLTILTALIALPVIAAAQKRPIPVPPVAKVPRAPEPQYSGPQEKAIVVSPDVTLNLCILRGKLTVNSWQRNEVRVFTAEGSKFDFKVLQKDTSGTPVWVSVNASPRPPDSTAVPPSDCLNDDDIEIEVPVGATLSIKGREVVLSVDSVKNVTVSTFGGGTQLKNITDGILAFVNRGNISIEDSSGPISVESTTGDILVFGVKPSKPGDTFRAKALSGNISIIDSRHRQIDGGTISGAISYTGSILNGGSYRFTSQSGNLRLNLPKDSSARIAATYGFGSFSSGFQLKTQTENVTGEAIKTIVGTIGEASEAEIKLTTISGDIMFRPVEPAAKPKN
ncbi:MAG: DUF4097 family beta strand repeat protein [Acidobacteria bacterium]|nr:DUF4097 family beta strand repeat protein [Acidobacteriota bacterium]